MGLSNKYKQYLQKYMGTSSDVDDTNPDEYYSTGSEKTDKRLQHIIQPETQRAEQIGEALSDIGKYSTDNYLTAPNADQYMQVNPDGSVTVQNKIKDKVTKDIHDIDTYQTYENPLYGKVIDKGYYSQDIFDQAILSGRLVDKEKTYTALQAELKEVNKILEDPEASPEQKTIAQTKLDTIKPLMEQPELYQQAVDVAFGTQEDISKQNTYIFNKLNRVEPETKDEYLGLWDNMDNTKYDPNKSKEPVTYAIRFKDKDGKVRTKIGYANDGGVFQRYLNQLDPKDYEIIGLHQGKDAAYVERRLHDILHKKLGETSKGNYLGSGHTEVYDNDIRPFTTEPSETSKIKESILYTNAINQAIERQQRLSMVTAKDELDNIGDQAYSGLIHVGAKAAEAILTELTLHNTNVLQDRESGIGTAINYFHQLAEDADAYAGVDPRTIETANRNLTEGFAKLKDGKVLDGLTGLISSFKAFPELAAKTLGMLLPVIVTSRVIGAEAFMLDGFMEAEHNIYEAVKNNNGKPISYEHQTAIYAGSLLNMWLQYKGMEVVIGKMGSLFVKEVGKTNKVLSFDEIKHLNKNVYAGTVKHAITETSKRVFGAGAIEGLAEFGDQIVTTLMQKMNTEKYEGKTLSEFVNEELPNALVAAWFGAGTGSMMHVRGWAEATVPFSDFAYKNLYKEDYINKSIHKYISTLNEEEYNNLKTQVETTEGDVKETYNTLYNTLQETNKGNIDNAVNTLLKQTNVDITGKENKNTYLHNVAVNLFSSLAFNMFSSNQFSNLVFDLNTMNSLGKMFTDSVNLDSMDPDVKATFQSKVIDILKKHNAVIDPKLTEVNALKDLLDHTVQTITNTGNKQMFNDLMLTLTSLHANSKNKDNIKALKKFNVEVFKLIHSTILNKEENLRFKNNLNNVIKNALTSELNVQQHTIKTFKTIKDTLVNTEPRKVTTEVDKEKAREQSKKVSEALTNITKQFISKYLKNDDPEAKENQWLMSIGSFIKENAQNLYTSNNIKDFIKNSQEFNLIRVDKHFNEEEFNKIVDDLQNTINGLKSSEEADINKQREASKEKYREQTQISDLLNNPTRSNIKKLKELIKNMSTKELEALNDSINKIEKKSIRIANLQRGLNKELLRRTEGEAYVKSTLNVTYEMTKLSMNKANLNKDQAITELEHIKNSEGNPLQRNELFKQLVQLVRDSKNIPEEDKQELISKIEKEIQDNLIENAQAFEKQQEEISIIEELNKKIQEDTEYESLEEYLDNSIINNGILIDIDTLINELLEGYLDTILKENDRVKSTEALKNNIFLIIKERYNIYTEEKDITKTNNEEVVKTLTEKLCK